MDGTCLKRHEHSDSFWFARPLHHFPTAFGWPFGIVNRCHLRKSTDAVWWIIRNCGRAITRASKVRHFAIGIIAPRLSCIILSGLDLRKSRTKIGIGRSNELCATRCYGAGGEGMALSVLCNIRWRAHAAIERSQSVLHRPEPE